jgi:hypothetical protein
LNLQVFKSIFFLNQLNLSDVFKELWVPILKGLKHQNIVLLETNSFKTLLGYAKNGHLVPVRLNKNKGLSLLTGGQYTQDRVGERIKFSPLIFQ